MFVRVYGSHHLVAAALVVLSSSCGGRTGLLVESDGQILLPNDTPLDAGIDEPPPPSDSAFGAGTDGDGPSQAECDSQQRRFDTLEAYAAAMEACPLANCAWCGAGDLFLCAPKGAGCLLVDSGLVLLLPPLYTP